MVHGLRKRLPSPAMTVACVALVVALGGTGYAAIVLPKNSVGTTQLKNNAVVSSKVKDGSLLAADFKSGQLPAGAAGPAGPAGATGAAGPAGPAGATKVVMRRQYTDGSGTFFGSASCNSGENVVGGGAFVASAGPNDAVISSSPSGASGEAATGWGATARTTGTKTLAVFAMCAAP